MHFRRANTERSMHFRKANKEPSMHFRRANTKPSMHFWKANKEPSMHFRRANAETYRKLNVNLSKRIGQTGFPWAANHSIISYWVNPTKRGGMDGVFRELAGLLRGISRGRSPREIPRSSPASPRKIPSIPTLLLRFTFSLKQVF